MAYPGSGYGDLSLCTQLCLQCRKEFTFMYWAGVDDPSSHDGYCDACREWRDKLRLTYPTKDIHVIGPHSVPTGEMYTT